MASSVLDDVVLPELAPGTYRHYKGQKYEVIGVAVHSETHESMVIYRPLYDAKVGLIARPYVMFTGTVTINGQVAKRFIKL